MTQTRSMPCAVLHGPLAALLFAGLVGCQGSTEKPVAVDPSHAAEVTAPMDVDGERNTVWEYLAWKYDDDGDGRILREEYQRAGDNFGRLDRNADGVLDRADFPDDSEEGPSMPMGELRAMLAVLLYLQEGEEVQRLSVEELEDAVLLVDADEDGLIDGGEFSARIASVRPALSGEGQMLAGMILDEDPWLVLLGSADEDGDARLALGEVFAFFDRNVNEAGIWDLEADRGEGPMSGPAPGTPAPDFRLLPPGGGEAALLSSFRDERPVALVFGSYT